MNLKTLKTVCIHFLAFVINTKLSTSTLAFQKVSEFLLATNYQISVINYDCDVDFVENVVLKQVKSRNVPYKVEHFKQNLKKAEIKTSAVLMFSSVKSLTKFNKNVFLSNFSPNPQFFVFCRNASFNEISSLKEDEILQFEYFLVDEENSIKLLTFEWFTSTKCNVTQLVQINEFNKTRNLWKNANFKVRKFHTFYGCKVVVSMVPQIPAFIVTLTDEKKLSFSGFNYEIVKEFAEIMNFTLFIDIFKLNSTAYQPYDVLIQLSSSSIVYKFLKIRPVMSTLPYMTRRDFIAVPPGESFNCYEKLLLPFDTATWALIVLVFFVAFGTTFIVAFMKNPVKFFVFGKNVTMPATNILRIFFGISQVSMPGRNFSRFLAMLFILYCLIIRTAWQSKMFEFMNKVKYVLF